MFSKEISSARRKIQTPYGAAWAYSPRALEEFGYETGRLPYSVKVLLENALRNSGKVVGAEDAAHGLAKWPKSAGEELPLMPYRVLLQDYTGVPLVVDLAAMRDAAAVSGIIPKRVNSSVPVDLIIDHSIQVDAWSTEAAFDVNLEREYERNSERYSLLKWAQTAFSGMRVFPPGKGICHQVNLEYLSKVVTTTKSGSELLAMPDTVLGTDSHTTMVNGLGVLGWGVGGIEAEAVMMGEPYHMPIPEVLGVAFHQLHPFRFAVGEAQVVQGGLVNRRDRDRRPVLRRHVSECSTVGYGELPVSLSEVLDELAHDVLLPKSLRDREHHVSGCDPFPQATGEFDA